MNRKGFASLIGLLVTLAIICWLMVHYLKFLGKPQTAAAVTDKNGNVVYTTTEASPSALIGTARQVVNDYNKIAAERAKEIDKATQP